MCKEKRKFKILSLILVTLLGLAVTWTILVVNGVFDKIDEHIVLAVVNFRGEKYNFLYWFMRIITEAAYVYFLIPFIIILLFIYRCDLKSLILTIGVLIQLLFNNILKLIIRRPRPDVIYHWMKESAFSFPSGHSMTASFLYGSLIYIIIKSNINSKKKIVLASLSGLMVVLIGFSRIILSVHFTSDVLGGFLWGFFFVFIGILVNESFGKKYNGLKNIINKRFNRVNDND